QDNPHDPGVVVPEVRLQGERRRMAGGAEAEFEEFAARDGGRLLGFALLLTGDLQDAEDLVQLALLRAVSHWSAARNRPEGATPGGWSATSPGPGGGPSGAAAPKRSRPTWPSWRCLPRPMSRRPCSTGSSCCARAGCCPCSSAPSWCCGSGRTARWMRQRPCWVGARAPPSRPTPAPWPGIGSPCRTHRSSRPALPEGGAMPTDHDLQAKLAEAFHQQADPVTADAIDASGIFRRGVRRRRRRIAAGVASAVVAAVLVAGVWVASAGGPAAGPGPRGPPPRLLP